MPTFWLVLIIIDLEGLGFGFFFAMQQGFGF